jgi:hypothetical protein
LWSHELREPIITGDSFIVVPDGRKDALDLAFRTFPELNAKFDGLDADLSEEVFSVYDLLSNETVRRWDDERFRRRSCDFMDSLAEKQRLTSGRAVSHLPSGDVGGKR